MNAALALWAGGTADSSTALIVQSPRSSTSRACGALEVIERPEDRQPAMLGRRGQAGQVGRVDDQHGVELEADRRPRLDVLHAGQQQRGQQLAIAQALVNPAGDFFEQPVARRLFDQPHERLDLGSSRTTFGSSFASAAETAPSRERNPRSPRPSMAPVVAVVLSKLLRDSFWNMGQPSAC